MSDAATNSPTSHRRLGRGLSALLGGGAPAYEERQQELSSDLRHLPTDQISRNPFQPRKQFDPEAIGELASSIREHGVLQPVLVREIDGGYQIIAGERRWQAAQKAGLVTIPCRIVDVIDKTACEFALEENLKRKDLNDLEKAQAFRDYLDQFQCSIEELSKQLSMKRSTVSNMLRLLDLPDPIKNALNSGRISAGHARALLPLAEAEQLELCGRIQAEQMSVRQTEAAVKKLLGRETPTENNDSVQEQTGAPSQPQEISQDQVPAAQSSEQAQPDHQHHEQPGDQQLCETSENGGPQNEQQSSQQDQETIPIAEGNPHRTNHVESLEHQLRDLLGVQVEIRLNSADSGQIVVPFANNPEFERILGILRRHAA